MKLTTTNDSAPREMTGSVHTVDQENVSATLTFAVPAARVFAVLADPATHAAPPGRTRRTDTPTLNRAR
jgi:hypothetical protein